MLVDPVTVAVNCWVWPAVSVAVNGETVTATGGLSVMVAEALLVVSAMLTAVTVAVVCAVILEGAV